MTPSPSVSLCAKRLCSSPTTFLLASDQSVISVSRIQSSETAGVGWRPLSTSSDAIMSTCAIIVSQFIAFRLPLEGHCNTVVRVAVLST